MDMNTVFQQPPSTTLELDEENLHTPPYQRQLNERHIRLIIDNWDERLCNPLVVASKTFNLIDGNHTCHALIRQGYTHGPARFVSAETIDKEMELFDQLNTSKRKLTTFERYQGWLSVNEPLALKTQEIMCKGYNLDQCRLASAPWGFIRFLAADYNTDDIIGVMTCFGRKAAGMTSSSQRVWRYLIDIHSRFPEEIQRVIKATGINNISHLYRAILAGPHKQTNGEFTCVNGRYRFNYQDARS